MIKEYEGFYGRMTHNRATKWCPTLTEARAAEFYYKWNDITLEWESRISHKKER